MKHSFRYRRALRFATKKHKGQFRMGGEPYVSHPIAVAMILEDGGYGEDYLIAALFHDLLEDTDATEDQIRRIGGERVLAAVKLVTKEKGYAIADYIARIKKDPIAFAVKGADRLHNLRCAVVAPEAFRRRYISESREWYADFSDEIIAAADDPHGCKHPAQTPGKTCCEKHREENDHQFQHQCNVKHILLNRLNYPTLLCVRFHHVHTAYHRAVGHNGRCNTGEHHAIMILPGEHIIAGRAIHGLHDFRQKGVAAQRGIG